MAIQNLREKVTLKLELDDGVVNGKQKLSSKSFTQIKTTATDEALYSTAITIADLQEKDLLKVKRHEVTSIFNE